MHPIVQKTLATGLDRVGKAGMFYFTVPGPKMIWQFGELGYDVSIDFNGRTGNKPIRWEYVNDADRKAIYDLWSKLIALKKQEDIFRTSDFTLDVDNATGLKTIHLTNDNASDDLQHVTIIGNFGITEQAIIPAFQQTGTWYDLLDPSNTTTVTNVNQSMLLQPGEVRIYGNSAVTLSNEDIIKNTTDISFYPNPSNSIIKINKDVEDVAIYNISGKKVLDYNGSYIKNHSFKIESLATGLYFVRGKTENNLFSLKLLVR